MITRKMLAISEKHLMAVAPFVYAATIVAMYFRGSRSWVDRFALAHWLVTYENGFIKRGLVGSIARIEMWSAMLHVSVADLIFGFSHFIMVIWCIGIWRLCCRVSDLKGVAFTVIPLVLASPLTFVTIQKTGYFDQFTFLLMMGIVVLLVKNITRWIAPVFLIGVLIHENIIVFYFPVLFYLGLIFVCLGKYQELFAHKFLFASTAILVPLMGFVFVFMAQNFLLSADETAAYIRMLLGRHQEVFTTGSDSMVYTFTVTFTDLFMEEKNAFFSRVFTVYGWASTVLPLALINGVLYLGLKRHYKRAAWFSIVGFFVMLAPASILITAWDADRIWSYPLFLGLLCVWLVVESGADFDYPVDRVTTFLQGMVSVVVLAMVIVPLWSDNLDVVTRLAIFSPLIGWLFLRTVTLRPAASP